MSDLAATNCGCGCEDNCNRGCSRSSLFGGSSCHSIIWILILLSLCNNGSTWGMGRCDDGCGCGNNSCLWIIILLFIFCGGCGSDCDC